MNAPLAMLRHYVTGAVERGEAEPIIGIPSPDTGPAFTKGQPVLVRPPMTPLAVHRGVILRRSPNGWRVRFEAWGMTCTETLPASALSPVTVA